MLHVLAHRRDRTLSMRTAVVLARGGPLGAAQTLATLESLAESWSPAIDDWNVVLLAPADRDLQNLVAALGGQLEVRWDDFEVERVRSEAARAGRRAYIFMAGDLVEPADPQLPRDVPLFRGAEDHSHLSNHASTQTTVPAFRWNTSPPMWARHAVAVYQASAVPYALTTRASIKIVWLSGQSGRAVNEDHLMHIAEVVDLIASDDPSDVTRFPRAAFVPRGGCLVPAQAQKIGTKQMRFCLVAVNADPQDLRAILVDFDIDVVEVDLLTEDGLLQASDALLAVSKYSFGIIWGRSYANGQFDETLVTLLRSGVTPITIGEGPWTAVEDSASLTYRDAETLRATLKRAAAIDPEVLAVTAAKNYDLAAGWCKREHMIYPHLAPFLASNPV